MNRLTRYPMGYGTTLADLEADPHPRLAGLRAHEPVSWLPAVGGWLVTRHDLASEVMRDAQTFTVDDPRFSTAQVIGPSMLSLDGSAHARHRAPFSRVFRPADVRARFTSFVGAEAARLVTGVRPAGRAELRSTVAGPLSVAVLAEALGLVGADAATVMSWYAAIVSAVSAISAGAPPEPDGAAAFARLTAGVQATIEAGRPSLLVEAVRPPDGLSADEAVANAAVIMFGGIDTTEGMIANLVLHLLTNPEAVAQVRAERGLLWAAIEESLRLEPAAARVDRYATRDVTLGGSSIERGDLVIVSLSAANRDPDVFADPDRFDLARPNNRLQLAFARGPHFCPGMDLARLEAYAAVTELLDRLPGLRLAAPTAPRGLVFRKPPALEVAWDSDGDSDGGEELGGGTDQPPSTRPHGA